METKRQLDVLNRQRETCQFIAGDHYTIAEIAIWPWYGGVVRFINLALEGTLS